MTFLFLFSLSLGCAATYVSADESPAAPSDAVLDAVQARFDTFRIRDDGKHFTPKTGETRNDGQAKRKRMQEAVAALDARKVQASGVLRLTALVLTEEDLRIISQLTDVRSVMFSRCTITAEGFAHLADAWEGSLNQLGMSYVDVQDGGSIAKSIAKLDKLTWLSISATQGIGMDVMLAVSEFPIQMLDMNRLPRGMPAQEVLQLLENKFAALRHLDLHHWKGLREERKAVYAKRPEVKSGTRFERQFGKANDAS